MRTNDVRIVEVGPRDGLQNEKQTVLTELKLELIERLAVADSFYLATASVDGQPYIQHRGGPPGFIRVLDRHRIAFADYRGNRQYISTGNLSENDRAQMFVMDYVNQRRVKIWGRAVTTQDPAIIAQLMPDGYRAQAEQAIILTVDVWDLNCPQHIPIKLPIGEVEPIIADLRAILCPIGFHHPGLGTFDVKNESVLLPEFLDGLP